MSEARQGKAAKCIRMLEYLSSGRLCKISEIADYLETNPRNVVEYRKELEEVGYIIENVSGRYGGYRLLDHGLIPSVKYSEEEWQALIKASAFLHGRADFPWAHTYEEAMGKLFSSGRHMSEEPLLSIHVKKNTMSDEEIEKRFRVIDLCIKRKIKLQISYLAKDNQIRERVIHPYKLFVYNESWFTIGYCELVNDFRVFKLIRIKDYRPTGQKFRVSLLYNEKDHFDEFGFKGKGSDNIYDTNHDEWVHVKIKLTGGPAMWIKESVYGKNQVLTELDDGATVLECDMHYRPNAIRFSLGFGENCEVLEPAWLKEERVKQAEKILEIEKK